MVLTDAEKDRHAGRVNLASGNNWSAMICVMVVANLILEKK